MFYNTGIATYIWIVDNNKPEERQGKVQLIDGTEFYEKRCARSSATRGVKLAGTNRATIVKLFPDDYVDTEHCRIVPIQGNSPTGVSQSKGRSVTAAARSS